MARVGDIMAATQILAEDSDNLMVVFSSKPQVDRVGLSDVKKDNGGSVVTAADVDTENVSSSEKNQVGNLRDEGFGGTSVLDSGIDGRVVFDCSLNGLVTRDEKISDDDFSCTGNVGSAGKRWKGSGRINLNVERLEDQDHGFRVGDFVWGKIKAHPWWPGQVHDPRDASEFALKHSQEGRVLVAFFGDGSCSWCLPSQLIPFVENLEEMSTGSSSKSFVNAVQRAVDEIGRVLESKITCKCIPLEKKDHIARPMVTNTGVRAGVLVPEVDIDCLPIPEYKPAEILAKVTDFAKNVSVGSVFEIAILRSWLSAYTYAKCGCQLPVYSEPRVIEGLEDKDDEETAVYNVDVPVTVPSQGPEDDDWISWPTVSSAKSQIPSDEKIYYTRKQKSVVELMVKPKNGKRNGVEGGKYCGMSLKSRKAKSVDSVVEKGASQGCSSRGKRSTGVEDKLEDEIVSTPRERKKSRYLSPPFTNLSGRIGYSEFDDIESASASAPVSELDDEAYGDVDDINSRAAENEKRMTFPASDVDVEVHELLQKLGFGAVNCFYLRKKGYLDSVWPFISAHRSSTYLRGSDYKIYQKCKSMSRKRKFLPSLPIDDDIISDAQLIRQKLDRMTAILENYCSRFSSDDKSCLKHEIKHLLETVETTGEKIRVMTENTSS